jgi:hypothetical protein
MTPIEIFEYKQRWKRDGGGYSVRLHSDLGLQGKDFCKVMMMKQQWDMTGWTAVYEHTFHFEYKQDADMFRNKFKKYADK